MPTVRGFRRATPADIDAMTDMVVRRSELIADRRDRVTEIDINPVLLSRCEASVTTGQVVSSCARESRR